MGVQIATRRGNFEREKEQLIVKGLSAASYTKTAEPIEIIITVDLYTAFLQETSKARFGMWARVGPRKHYQMGCTLAQPGEYA